LLHKQNGGISGDDEDNDITIIDRNNNNKKSYVMSRLFSRPNIISDRLTNGLAVL